MNNYVMKIHDRYLKNRKVGYFHSFGSPINRTLTCPVQCHTVMSQLAVAVIVAVGEGGGLGGGLIHGVLRRPYRPSPSSNSREHRTGTA